MDDTTQSTSSIERDVERTRSDLDDTINELKDRFSPEAIVDYGANYLGGPDGKRLLDAIRQNPLAAALAAAGIGWLLYTANSSRPPRARTTRGSGSQGDRDQRGNAAVSRPGVLGDGTQEQNLNQTGDPGARITRQEVEAAFGQDGSKT